MNKQQFNIEIARKVMGWEVRPGKEYPFQPNPSGYLQDTEDGEVDGFDFYDDHNAAALVRGRVAELGVTQRFISYLTGDTLTQEAHYKHGLQFALLSATPAQTARAAYRAVTGEELEAVDE